MMFQKLILGFLIVAGSSMAVASGNSGMIKDEKLVFQLEEIRGNIQVAGYISSLFDVRPKTEDERSYFERTVCGHIVRAQVQAEILYSQLLKAKELKATEALGAPSILEKAIDGKPFPTITALETICMKGYIGNPNNENFHFNATKLSKILEEADMQMRKILGYK